MPALDVAYINPFIKAVDGLFSTMVKVPSSLKKPRLMEKGEDLSMPYSISVEVGLEGATQGTVSVSFSKPVALALASALAGMQMTDLDADCKDALGEVGNMIVGQAKTELSAGGPIQMSVPRVLDTTALQFPSDRPILILPFDSALGPFLINVACKTAA